MDTNLKKGDNVKIICFVKDYYGIIYDIIYITETKFWGLYKKVLRTYWVESDSPEIGKMSFIYNDLIKY
jgi:hypothetical protein